MIEYIPMRTASGGQGIRRLRRANLPWSAPVTIRRRRGAKFAVRPQSEILLSSRVDVVSRARLIALKQRLIKPLLHILLLFYTQRWIDLT